MDSIFIYSSPLTTTPLFHPPKFESSPQIKTIKRPIATSSTRQKSLGSTVCDTLDEFINTVIDNPPRPSLDPNVYYNGTFAPVDEQPPVLCPVTKGSIPRCLGGGAYVRNGPNAQYRAPGPHHYLDGDGMLHSLLLPEGGGSEPAVYCSRYVETYRYRLEREAGGLVFPKVFSGFVGAAGAARGAVMALRVLIGQINPLEEGIGLGNTSVLSFGNKLFALAETDLPYAFNLSSDGDISTVDRYDFDGKLSGNMTAHPKKDHETGELFAFRYGPLPPYLTYFWFDRDGNKQPDVPISSVSQPSFNHDFAITERYAIFLDIQLVVKPLDMVFKGEMILGMDSGKVPRIGVIPRYARSDREVRWFDVPGFNPVHTINAWEEDDETIVLVAPNVISIEHLLERPDLIHNCIEMVTIDLRFGRVSRRPLSAGNFDFGVMNPRFVGRKNRFAYVALLINESISMPNNITGVAKLDYKEKASVDCVVAVREFPKSCYGGEPFFVANGGDDEDDGYLVMFTTDVNREESRFVVMDAKSTELDVVAEVLLPRRIPYGLHGLFVSQFDLKNQQLVK